VASRDEGMIEERHTAAGAKDDACGGERRADVRERTGQREDKLAAALTRDLLTLGIGVGKQAANGQEQNGTEAKAQPRRRDDPCRLTHGHGRHKKKKKHKGARPTVRTADGKQNQDEQREEDVDAHLHTQPSAQRNGPATHRSIVEEGGKAGEQWEWKGERVKEKK